MGKMDDGKAIKMSTMVRKVLPLRGVLFLLLLESGVPCVNARGQEVAGLKEGFEGNVLRWTFSQGEEFPGAKGGFSVEKSGARTGQAGGRLSYDFTEGGAYVAAYAELSVPLTPAYMEFWVRKSPSLSLTVRATDKTGQTCQKPLFFEHGDWQKVRVRMDRWTFGFGGPGDGILRPPVVRVGLLAESKGLIDSEKKGVVDMDDWTWIPGNPTQPGGADLFRYRVHDFEKDRTYTVGETQDKFVFHPVPERSLFGQPTELRVGFQDLDRPIMLLLRAASHFQGFELIMGPIEPKQGETWVGVPSPPEGWRHFGGQNDGKLHGPVRFHGIGFSQVQPGPCRPVQLLGIDCVTRLDPWKAVMVVPRHESREGKDKLIIDLHNLTPQKVAGELTITARDEEGHPLQTTMLPVVLEGKGHPESVSFPSPGPQEGILCVDYELHFATDNGALRSDRVSAGWAGAALDPGSSDLDPSSPWGMGLYLYRYSNNEEGFQTMERAAAMARAAGVKWSREEFQWHRMEPSAGQFDFDFYDRMLDVAHAHGISVYGLLAYWSSWTEPYTEQGISDYCRWVQAVVERYKDRVHHWEIWNEPNIFFWSGPKELYPVLLQRAHDTIKSVDPTAQVLGASTAGIDTAFVKFCLEAGASFDILTIHPYRAFLDDKGFMKELRNAKDLVQGKEVWITEMGWSTQIGGVSELEQAKLLARTYLCAVASQAAPNVSWYDFREDGEEPFYNEHHFGAVRHNLAVKPAFLALATVCRTLGSVRASRSLETPEGFLAYAFESSDRPDTTVLWSPRKGGTLVLKGVQLGQTRLSLVGRQTNLSVHGDKALVTIPPGAPVYLPEAKDLHILGEPLRIGLEGAVPRPGKKCRIRVQTVHLLDQSIQGNLEWILPPQWQIDTTRIRLRPGKSDTRFLELSVPSGTASGTYPLQALWKTSYGEIRAFMSLYVPPETVEI